MWDKLFKSGLSKFCGRQPFENLLSPLLNTFSHFNSFLYFAEAIVRHEHFHKSYAQPTFLITDYHGDLFALFFVMYFETCRFHSVSNLANSEVTSLGSTQKKTAIEAFIYFQKSDDDN